MMKKIIRFLIPVLVLFIFVAPVLSFAQEGGLVPCNGPDCNFGSFMTLINNVINFMLFKLALPIAAIMFAYAGFIMVTAGESAAEARTKAKGIFSNALIGMVLAFTCWIIVYSLLKILGYDGGWIGL